MLSKNIFIYWNTGFNQAQQIVKLCLSSWKKYNKNWNIIELDNNNLSDWIDLNSIILNIQNKNITNTSLSDIIRICLLQKYGGIWCDATLLCVKPLDDWINEYYNNGFFAFEQNHHTKLSSWFLYGEKDNYIINKWYQNVIDYINKANIIGLEHNPIITLNQWNNNDKYNSHYFWFHYLFTDIYNCDDRFKFEWDNIKKISGVPPHYIQNIGFCSKVTNDFISTFKNSAPVFKLTYRYDFTQCKNDSILQYINDLDKYKITFIFDNSYVNILIKVINNILTIEDKYYYNYFVFYLTFWGSKEEEDELRNKILNLPIHINFVIKNIMTSYPKIYNLCTNLYNVNQAQNHLKTPLLYCRGFLPEIWEDINDKLLYMDLDIIIFKPLSLLFNEILCKKDDKLIVCNNQKLKSNFGEIKNIFKIINDNKEEFKNYSNNLINKILATNINFETDNNEGFNAGIFILNLNECRKFNYTELFEICMHINKFENIFPLNDQSIMNFIFFKDYNIIDNNWNYMGTYGSDTCNYKKIFVNNSFDNENLKIILDTAYIFHFVGPNKPWNTEIPEIKVLWKY